MNMIPQPSAVSYIPLGKAREEIGKGTPVVDVRIPEAYGESHIAGAENFCVYEVAFGEKFSARFPDQEQKIVVYGESSQFRAAEMAYGRLQQLGYFRIVVLEHGLDAWQRAGFGLESGRKQKGRIFPTGQLPLSLERSRLRWTGRNLTNQHHGQIQLKSGSIELAQEGLLAGGEAAVDMTRISCEDIGDSAMNRILVDHLSNVDFFDVSNYPEARFKVLQAECLVGGTPGQPNYRIYGEMTLRGSTRVIEFKSMLYEVPDGVSFQAQIDVNRVNFGAVYGSGSLFERLGMHLVNDFVGIDLTLIFEAG
jgi:rhodanese-related sulfurtransferase/polyisoprenoid-binding protein YceI